jgi:hypothetical protein
VLVIIGKPAPPIKSGDGRSRSKCPLLMRLPVVASVVVLATACTREKVILAT